MWRRAVPPAVTAAFTASCTVAMRRGPTTKSGRLVSIGRGRHGSAVGDAYRPDQPR
jgi:hypothetical protein